MQEQNASPINFMLLLVISYLLHKKFTILRKFSSFFTELSPISTIFALKS